MVEKSLNILESNPDAYLSFISNPENENRLERSHIQLIRNRIQYIWQRINQELCSNTEFVIVSGDYKKGCEIFLTTSPGPMGELPFWDHYLRIFKKITEPFSDCFCRVEERNGKKQEKSISFSNANELFKYLHQWCRKTKSVPKGILKRIRYSAPNILQNSHHG